MIRLDDFPAAEKALIGGGAAVAAALKLNIIETTLAVGIGVATFVLVVLRCILVVVEIRDKRRKRRE